MFVDEPVFLVTTRGDKVLDYVVANVMLDHGNDINHVKDLAIRSEARGDSLGRQLFAQSLAAMTIAGAAVVKPEVHISNDPTIGLYRNLGFEPTRRVSSYYGDGKDAYVMVLDAAEWQRA